MKEGRILFALCELLLIFIANSSAGVPSTTTVWIKPQNGNWNEDSAWSAGLPSSLQSVAITNAGQVTVTIDAATAQSVPGSLSMTNLIVANTNTLVLDNVGATLSIDTGTNIFNGLQVSHGGRLINYGTHVSVNTSIRIDGGEIVQDGGVVEPSSGLSIANGSYSMTNGVFNSSWVDLPSSGTFHQYGGRFLANKPLLIRYESNFYLHSGEVLLEGDGRIGIGFYSTFTQEGGVVRAPIIGVGYSDGSQAYLMDGGECYVGDVFVTSFRSESVFEQNAGLLVITNGLKLVGSSRYYPPVAIEARYTLGSNGVMRATSLTMDQTVGFCAFESSGNATFSGDIGVVSGDWGDFVGYIGVSDGSVSCQNFSDGNGLIDIAVTGGALNVANTFSFDGYYPGVYDGINARPTRFTLSGGSFSANEIELGAEWVIDSSTRAGRISNAGHFLFGGTLRVGDAVEHLGKLILTDNSTIDLGSGSARLSFASSSGEQWTNSALLHIDNWQGSPSGGGSDQLKFGNNGSGLSPRQLSQIIFINPAGFPAGQYSAQILDTGEIVPFMAPQLSVAADSNNMVISWADNHVLQSAPHVEGPYVDVPSATSPYSVDVSANTQLFLRLRP